MRLAGYTLIGSFNPIRFIMLKHHYKLSLNIVNDNLTKAKTSISHIQKHQLHTKEIKEMKYY